MFNIFLICFYFWIWDTDKLLVQGRVLLSPETNQRRKQTFIHLTFDVFHFACCFSASIISGVLINFFWDGFSFSNSWHFTLFFSMSSITRLVWNKLNQIYVKNIPHTLQSSYQWVFNCHLWHLLGKNNKYCP